MISKSNLPNRTKKARAASQFAKSLGTDSIGRANVIEVPGSDGKRYTVKLTRWDSLDLIYTTCENGTVCKGNSLTVCYHSMSAILHAANGKADVRFCASLEDADRLAKMGGKVLRVVSEQAPDSNLYTVVRRAK